MIKLSFYGDDFTGSTDVMESLTLNNVPTALFLEAPSPEEIMNFRLKNAYFGKDRKLKAFGVAGISRTLSCAQMDEELPLIFEKISKIPMQYFHYKVCSTFDSSSEKGSIGHAVQIAQRYFPSLFIPLIVGIPFLNRFCVFGNLFAKVDNDTYRLDRHPTMANHPITPMNESDLRLHLGKQTKQSVQLMDVLQLENDEENGTLYKKYVAKGGFILFDVLTIDHLIRIGDFIGRKKVKKPQLLVGSSGVEYALCSYWQRKGTTEIRRTPISIAKAARYIVMVGSCSPRSGEQIKYSLEQGYSPVPINTCNLIRNRISEIENCTQSCISLLQNDFVPIVYMAIGPEDPCIKETKECYESSSIKEPLGTFLASAQGEILKNVIDKVGKIRITVAGGDTSGFVTTALEIYALEILAPIAPGAPLCLAHAKNSKYDGLEISLKGGQNGNNAFFLYVQNGKEE